MGERIEQIGSGECSITVEAYRGKVHVTVLGEEAQGIVLDSPVALINALLRLCTHAQLGEVVVPRRAGEWERDNAYSVRYDPDRGQAGMALDVHDAWVARTWGRAADREDGRIVRTEHPTRAEAEAAVDERLRADGVVLP